MIKQQEIIYWNQVYLSEMTYIKERQNFLNTCQNKIEIIRQALHKPTERGTALRLLEYFYFEDIKILFNDLIELASVAHSDIELCRKVILLLPKDWLLENIEKSAELILNQGTDEEYRRLLELYLEIDLNLTKKLTEKALENDDDDIVEVGEDFRDYLQKINNNGYNQEIDYTKERYQWLENKSLDDVFQDIEQFRETDLSQYEEIIE
jgi:hypothetical protein